KGFASMSWPKYHTLYDFLHEGTWGSALTILTVGVLLALVLGVGSFACGVETRRGWMRVLSSAWLVVWVCLGSLLISSRLSEQERCLQWGRTKNFQIAAGPVTNFEPP